MPHLDNDDFTLSLLTNREVLDMNEFSSNNRETRNDEDNKVSQYEERADNYRGCESEATSDCDGQIRALTPQNTQIRYWAATSTKSDDYYFGAVFNNADEDAIVAVDPVADFFFTLSDDFNIFDVWSNEELSADDLATLSLPSHGVRLLKFCI